MNDAVKWRREILNAIERVQDSYPHVAERAIACELIQWALELLDDADHLQALADAFGVYCAGRAREEAEMLKRQFEAGPDDLPAVE